MAKKIEIMEMLEKRVLNGDYLVNPFPTDAQIAKELNANRITVRRAIQDLIDKGLLVREKGRVSIIPEATASRQIALLIPTFPSPAFARWHRVIELQVEKRGWKLRVIGYDHWDDHVINSTIQGFDAVFLVMLSEETPEAFYQRIKESGKKVLILNEDVSSYDLPCLWLASPERAMDRMLEYLQGLGHSKIDCLNTQPHDNTTMLRLSRWHLWTKVHDIKGHLIDEAVESYQEPMNKAYEVIDERVKANKIDSTALLCTTGAAAVGAMRALKDNGIIPGEDISVASLDDRGGEAKYMTTSLTCTVNPKPTPYVNVCLDWMADDATPWKGPLLFEPVTVDFFEGESTIPCPPEKG